MSDRDLIINWIRDFHELNGRTPTTAEYQLESSAPTSLSVLKREFGNFGDAVVAAGFDRPTRGRRVEPVIDVPVTPPGETQEASGEPVDATAALSDLVRELEEQHARVQTASAALIAAEEAAAATRNAIIMHPMLADILDADE